jgi:hypothetical protein
MNERPRCIKCGSNHFVTRLHRDRGGPMVCARCGEGILIEIDRDRKKNEAIRQAFGFDSLAAWGGGPQHSESAGLSLDLLNDVLSLVHPDKHPPERALLAHRVTVELLAIVASRTVQDALHTRPAYTVPHRTPPQTGEDPLHKTPAYPCSVCRHTVPLYYCDPCRRIWEGARHARRQRDNEAARSRRARKRLLWQATCAECQTVFKPTRRDACYCSAACRQKAHRARVRHPG